MHIYGSNLAQARQGMYLSAVRSTVIVIHRCTMQLSYSLVNAGHARMAPCPVQYNHNPQQTMQRRQDVSVATSSEVHVVQLAIMRCLKSIALLPCSRALLGNSASTGEEQNCITQSRALDSSHKWSTAWGTQAGDFLQQEEVGSLLNC
eukprot:scpid13322/ scgid8654/ 